MSTYTYISYFAIGLQVAMQFCLIFWFFFLIWKTFLFRFGLLNILITKEFPILILVPLNFAFFIVETLLRPYYCSGGKQETVITLYTVPVYQVFFWIRHALSLFLYAGGIKAAIYIGHPSYYKPQKWTFR
mmetsp:Transcript_1345/g.1377  ORF Transcript_1345/g.1377 Transcript_1345/m.1377 type:complete len:130 (-) Transcript_1345:35-424(-)